MKWIKSRNNQVLNLNDIPVLDIDELRKEILEQYKINRRVIGFFGCQ